MPETATPLAYPRVAVLGAGTMGHALALVHALGGCRVRLQDIDRAALARAPGLIAAAAGTLVASGACTAAEADAARSRIATSTEAAEAVADADLVVEAIVEDTEIKRGLFAEIARHAPAHAVVASNTSYLDVFPLMPETLGPRALIVHWYTPPYIVDLVDLVGGPATDPAEVERMRGFLTDLGKHPVVLRRFVPGYVANRIQAAINQEVYWLLDEGIADAQTIDDAIRHGLATRLAILGHMMKADYTGLDMVQRGLASGAYVVPEPRTRSTTLDALIAAGRRGVTHGAGFYDYGGRSADALFAERDRKLLALKAAIARIEEEGT